jgi:hypothetical protein|tara:strand:- start:2057 stop:2647 length:591 start_codon:yes stop_codon:yes gene_type:complete
MERSKAYTLLGLEENATSEEITDALDQVVFKVRDQFLRGAVIPKLAASRVERCVLLSDVAQTLGVAALGAPVAVPQALPLAETLEGVVRGHLENVRRCRTAMAATLDPDSVAQLGNMMANLQSEYMKAFLRHTESLVDDDFHEAVPAREEVDWMALLAAMRAHEEGPGGGALLQELVRKERARMRAMVSATATAQH